MQAGVAMSGAGAGADKLLTTASIGSASTLLAVIYAVFITCL